MAKKQSAPEVVSEVVLLPLDSLVPNPRNPRQATDEEIAKLAEKIKKMPNYFEKRPILVSDRTGQLVIIDGEQRSKAARLNGMEKVPVAIMSGLSEADEDFIMVNGNTHAGFWDKEKLKKITSTWGNAAKEWLSGEKPAKGKKWAEDANDSEVKFSEVLNESHNYIVLYFDNDVDWLQLCTLLHLPQVIAYSTRVDGKITDGNRKIGVGRVFRGAEILEKLKKAFSE